MYCSKCGSQIPDSAVFCVNCGQSLAAPPFPQPGLPVPPAVPPIAPAATALPPAGANSAPPPGATYTPPPSIGTWPPSPSGAASAPYLSPGQAVYVPMPSPFAGFWLRFVALMIDSIILMIGAGIFIAVVIAIIGLGTLQNAFDSDNAADFLPASIILGIVFVVLALTVGQWLYFAWMESSSYQGTFGKMALGLIVTDLQGRRVSFGRATGRYFSKIITGLIPFFIGYIMAGLTEKKQALHDMIASCLVLRKT